MLIAHSLRVSYVCMFLICSFPLIAQVKSDRDVPDIVQKNFSKMFPNAENVSWDKVDDNYKADCFYKGRGTYAEFTPSGEWIITITDLDTETLYAPIQRYLDENFKKDKVVLAEAAMKADKQNYYYVQVEHKDPSTKQTYPVELFFDKTGRIEQVKLPEGVNDMTVVGIDNPNENIPVAVIDSWKRRFPRAENIEWATKTDGFYAYFLYREQQTRAEFTTDGEWVESRVTLTENELHRMIQTYLIENHKDDDYLLGELVTRADRNDYYFVKMQRLERGQTRPYLFELYFDRGGKIQRVIRPEVLKNQYLLTVDIPPMIAKKFSSRFAGASEVTWETSDNHWIARFIYRNQITSATFSDTASWVQTVSQMDIKNLYTPIQRTLDQNYSDYRVTYAEKVVRADRENYYYVELISKKKNLTPQKLGLFFDKTGRIKED